MPRDLFKHPGYLGWTSRGVILIHADWPAYATEHGVGYALMSLGQFPLGSQFTLVDDIDQCYLFVLGAAETPDGPFAAHRFHVALWHEDLQALAEAGYVDGSTVIPYNEWAKRRIAELRGLLWKQPDGTLAPVPLPDFEDEDGDFPPGRKAIVDGPIGLTTAGYAALDELLRAEKHLIAEPLMARARPAILARLYDSAIREACVVLEAAMREALNSKEFGAKLIDQFFTRASASEKFIAAQLKTFRTDVRAVFRFVRNEFAHNIHVLTETQCYALLVRISGVYDEIQSLSSSIRSDA